MPHELADTFVASRRAMGAVDYGTVVWDLDRVRAAATTISARGEILHSEAVIDRSDGAIAGFTELVVPGSGTGEAQHHGAVVLPQHRGRGLTRWMKAISILHARERHPHLGGLLTDTADNNPHGASTTSSATYRRTQPTSKPALLVVQPSRWCSALRQEGE
ncbi:hypothetical protein [Streptomyces noursei]|uniref:hypothetical protein n=1 Tax=Streptomyces noursei TaxID=1971 RepID=UPI001F03538B|nr:hypothetical protein [Streptomyces noursei]